MSIRGIQNASGGRAWGNIFQVNTPYLDQLGNQIYQQEQLRQANQAKESDKLDQEFSKSVANIRDADVNEYADKYQAYKNAKINLMKINPNQNSKKYIAAQMDANRKLADMSQFGNESISNKAGLKNVAAEYGKDVNSGKGMFRDDTGNMISKANELPSSKWGSLTMKNEKGEDVPYDPVNPDVYRYAGNLVDWQPKLKNAEGTKPKPPIKASTTALDPNHPELGTQSTFITAKNSPSEYFNSVYGSFKGANAPRSFVATYPEPSDNEMQRMTEAYNNEMNNPNSTAVKGWGKEGMQLPTNAILTPAGRSLSYQTMKYALENLPQEGAPKADVNPIAKMQNQQAYGLQKQQIGIQAQRELAGLKETYSERKSDYDRAKTTADKDNVVNNAVNDMVNAGSTRLAGTDFAQLNIDGKSYVGKVIQPPNAVIKDFATHYEKADINNKVGEVRSVPSAIYITNDGKTIIPLHLGKQGPSGNYELLSDSKPQSVDNLKASLSKLFKANTQTTTTTSQKTYSVGGKTLTDEQIQKGANKYTKGDKNAYLKSLGLQ